MQGYRADHQLLRKVMAGSVGLEFGDAAPIFAALGDATRLHIVARLCDGGPLSIARLTEGTKITRQAVTKHLRALEMAGLISGGRSGREHVWELQTKRLAEVREYLDEISAQWNAALSRLRNLVEVK